MTLEELFAGRPVDIPRVLEDLKQVAAGLGLPFGSREKTYNSRLAQELGKLAEQQGKGDQYHSAVFRAYFASGHNIGLETTLADLAKTLGLDAEAVQEALEKRIFKELVDEDWKRSRQLEITAVPTFLLNGTSLVGAQSYEKLVALMDTHGVQRRV